MWIEEEEKRRSSQVTYYTSSYLWNSSSASSWNFLYLIILINNSTIKKLIGILQQFHNDIYCIYRYYHYSSNMNELIAEVLVYIAAVGLSDILDFN